LEAGNIHYEGHWKGWALEIETFLGSDMATSESSAIWAQKSRETLYVLRCLFYVDKRIFCLNLVWLIDRLGLVNSINCTGYVNIASVTQRLAFAQLKVLSYWENYTHITMNVRGDGRCVVPTKSRVADPH
jgi:hypothetical protein